jgi:predicted site-specific integrase-resolvase
LETEPFRTYKEAAGILNVPYYKVQRGAKRGLFPVHRLYNGRPLVLVSEIQQAMKKNKKKDEGGEE